MNKWKTWTKLPNNKSTWAFYHYCKRRGDKVKTQIRKDRTIDLAILKKIEKRSSDE